MAYERNKRFLKRAHTALLYLGGMYATFIILLATPWFQRHVIYMHAMRWPFRENFTVPELSGLAPGKTLNLNLTTSDGVRPGELTFQTTGMLWRMAANLEQEGMFPRGIVLLSPYSSVPKLLETYNLLGKIPILQPLRSFRFVFDIMLRFLRHRFKTISIINDISCPIAIIHAADDWDIPVSHARALFNSLLEPLLPAYPFDSKDVLLAKVPHSEILQSTKERDVRREELVAVTEVEGLGTTQRFERDGNKGSVTMHAGDDLGRTQRNSGN
ncbi:hypothetical protein FS749_009500 [Ceratobasidium sp. UAMH 11750]|nr:hypothetical protein FS749_009500 [Ceratobasidium sp. UAMH 11750]